jgi:hypothetical protein
MGRVAVAGKAPSGVINPAKPAGVGNAEALEGTCTQVNQKNTPLLCAG